MKFGALALLFAGASATTIKIDDQLVSKIGENWQRAAFKLQRTLEELERQEEKELEPYMRALQKDVETIYRIDMGYGEKWMQAADQKAKQTWEQTKGIMGCSQKNWKCNDPIVFFQTMPRSIEACGCKDFPVQISNSRMECAQTASGSYVCM